MSMVFRLFQRKKKNICAENEALNEVIDACKWAENELEEMCYSASPFPLDHSRLVLFRECEWKERRLIFDSATIRPRRASEGCSTFASGSVECSGQKNSAKHCQPTTIDGKFECSRPRADTKMLGEMIFGAVSMSFKGESMKLHQIRSPAQIMLSKILPYPRSKRISQHPMISEQSPTSSECNNRESDNDSQYSTVCSLNELMRCSGSRSIPVDIPERIFKRTPSPDILRSSSGGNSSKGEKSATGDFPSGPGLIGSFHRRALLNQQMSLDSGIRRQSSDSSGWDDEPFMGGGAKKRMQLGIAVLFSSDEDGDEFEFDHRFETFKRFLYSHAHFVQLEIQKLQSEICKACLSKSLFFELVHKAWTDFRHSLTALYSSPRLRQPIWLELMNSAVDVQDADWGMQCCPLINRFMQTFCSLIDRYESKETNFFISSLLSAVLLHHLTWVFAVAPNQVGDCFVNTGALTMGRDFRKQWSENASPTHPYNPYFAQLMDIFGALCSPGRIVKTVVVGTDRSLVLQILFILSYFIRCSHVREVEISNAEHESFLIQQRLEAGRRDSLGASKRLIQTAPDRRSQMESEVGEKEKPASTPKDFTSDFKSEFKLRPRSRSFIEQLTQRKNQASLGRRKSNESIEKTVKDRIRSKTTPKAANESAAAEKEPELKFIRDVQEKSKSRNELPNSFAAPETRRIARFDVVAVQSLPSTSNNSFSHSPAVPVPSVRFENVPPDTSTTSTSCSAAAAESIAVSDSHTKQFLSYGCEPIGEPSVSAVLDVPSQSPIIPLGFGGNSPNFGATKCKRSTDSGCPATSSDESAPEDGHKLHEKGEESDRAKCSVDSGIGEGEALELMERERKNSTHSRLFGSVQEERVAKVQSSRFDKQSSPLESLGSSLLGGFCDGYQNYFTLQGLKPAKHLVTDIQEDLRAQVASIPVVGDLMPTEAVCVVADTTNWTVRIHSNSTDSLQQLKTGTAPIVSQAVCSMVEQIRLFHSTKLTADFCLMHLEECLAELYNKSCALTEFIDEQAEVVNTFQLADAINCDISDLPLLMSVASLHSPTMLGSLDV